MLVVQDKNRRLSVTRHELTEIKDFKGANEMGEKNWFIISNTKD